MTPDGSSAKSNEKGPLAHRGTLTTESSEDYLEAILVIRAERGFCRNVDIAERLGVSGPSVTKALASHHPFAGATPTFALTCTIFTMRKRSDAPMLSFVEGFSPVLSIWR